MKQVRQARHVLVERVSGTHDVQARQTINLITAIDKVPQPFREAIELLVLAGMSSESIAEVLAVSETTVSRRIRTAQQQVKKILQEQAKAGDFVSPKLSTSPTLEELRQHDLICTLNLIDNLDNVPY